MAILDILEFPDPRLELHARPVKEFDASVVELAGNLLDTLHAHRAIGLSATQVNDQRQILAMDLSENADKPEVYINPEIIAKAAWGIVEESCLSVPGIVGNVIRATQVKVRAQDQTGASFERELSGMNAVCLQHEMDHLAGKLFIDRLSIFRRLSIRTRARKKARQKATAAQQGLRPLA